MATYFSDFAADSSSFSSPCVRKTPLLRRRREELLLAASTLSLNAGAVAIAFGHSIHAVAVGFSQLQCRPRRVRSQQAAVSHRQKTQRHRRLQFAPAVVRSLFEQPRNQSDLSRKELMYLWREEIA
ncbi:uncharacterized protein LOC121743499 isoform X2 [Salvia splendens]|uniref:uncharacterized protein LOC121743499 isoform X2 n=1 Tax=Salvia splendens TaxID=180675 RepID=UPI001C2615F0|nr:uncharacterized protein LOC121743499 isoform X2 [Salvia splendens]